MFKQFNPSKVWYLGGFNQNRKSKTIYEISATEMKWKPLELQLPIPLANDTIVALNPIPQEECKPPSLSLGKKILIQNFRTKSIDF